jgi:hypothetical protein
MMTWDEIRELKPGDVLVHDYQISTMKHRMGADWVERIPIGQPCLVVGQLWEKMDAGAWIQVLGPKGLVGFLPLYPNHVARVRSCQ